MIAPLLLAVLPASLAIPAIPAIPGSGAPGADVVPFAWGRAERVEVQAVLAGTVIQHRYVLLLDAAPGGALDVRRTDFRRIEIVDDAPPPAEEPEPEAADEADERALPDLQFDPALDAVADVRERHVPAFRVGPDGALREFLEVSAALDVLARDLNPPGSGLWAATRKGMENELYRETWLAKPRYDWDIAVSAWTGLPLEPGTHELQGEVYVPSHLIPRIPARVTVEVSEPFEEDGRRVVRLVRTARLVLADLGEHAAAYLSALSIAPSDRRLVADVKAVHRDDALFDLEHGLPLRIVSEVRTVTRMESTRRMWREPGSRRFELSFDWTLRGE